MKTHKKIVAGLLSIFVLFLAFFIFGHRQASAEDAGPNFWGQCVDAVLGERSGIAECASVLNNGRSEFTYASYGRSVIVGATYQGSNTDNTRPDRIILLGNNNQPIEGMGINYYNVVYAGTFTSKSGQQYFAYRPLGGSGGQYNYRFLVKAEPNTNNTYQVLALVWNELQSGGPSGDGFVEAWSINKATILSSPTGAPVEPDPSGGVDKDATCEAISSNPLTWIMCPLFTIAEGLANFLIEEFEKQLCFKVDVSETSANTECTVTPTEDIKPAWDAVKNIVSALLVIVMLIAVFAQAASIGPIDAYTLRKLLPRLVAAVILIQISFYLFSWIVNLVDDMGEGLGDLFAAIFPGNINNLNFLLGNADIGTVEGGVVSWIVLLAGITAIIFALPAVLLALFLAVVALFIALAVLVFRKILIIALLIIAPVALLLWVLPNTERYWKMWWDNFLKVLLMYPIIVLLIEAGRIFAYVAGPTLRDGSPLIALFVVMIGFFGPLFILPKTYRWGGAMMQAVGQGSFRAGGMLAKPGQDYLNWRKGFSRWSQARAIRRGEIERRSRLGMAEGLQGSGIRGGINRARLLGVGTPGRERDIRRRATQSAEAALEQDRREQIQQATIQLIQRDLPQYAPGDHDDVRDAIIRGETIDVHRPDGTETSFNGQEYAANHPQGLRAALDRGVIHGQWRGIEQHYNRVMASGDQQQITELQDFLNSNSQAIGNLAPHMLKGMGVASSSKPEDLVQQRGEAVESIVGNNIVNRSINRDTGGVVGDERNTTYLRSYASTAADSFRRGSLNPAGARAIRALVTNDTDILNQINVERREYNLPELRHEAIAHILAEDPSIRESIESNFTRDGTAITNPQPPPGAAAGEVRIEHEAPPPAAAGGRTQWSAPAELPPEPSDQGPLRPPPPSPPAA